ncbi:hypothetical protein HELRODRAFT_90408 [Helobdella robusta]|uniref:GRAM domain-containing protein n=1 Tax=Helobdella robusta TaxID=6412 RepID=T1G7R0_HELRO|nr:hypothetical protein HELRODRAFT_90408 [Helobdella robusta]ESN91157.1 hypothetical protein HELRODRAFT_90408 [Helobdella robusta]
MSLNTSHAGKDGVVLFNSERIFIYHDGVELSFDKAWDNRMKGKKSGRIYLTTHRVIFVNKDNKDKLLSLSMPFHTMKKLELEQPVFGANYIAGVVKAEQGANWQGEAMFKLVFYKGGAIEFGQAMLQAGKLASRYAPPQPPTYSPPMAPYYEAPPPAYTPQMQYGGIYPSPVFNVQPPPGSVYMYDIPPPYPGVDPNLPPYPISQPAQPFSVPQYPGLCVCVCVCVVCE